MPMNKGDLQAIQNCRARRMVFRKRRIDAFMREPTARAVRSEKRAPERSVRPGFRARRAIPRSRTPLLSGPMRPREEALPAPGDGAGLRQTCDPALTPPHCFLGRCDHERIDSAPRDIICHLSSFFRWVMIAVKTAPRHEVRALFHRKIRLSAV